MNRFEREIARLRNQKARLKSRLIEIDFRIKDIMIEMARSAYGNPGDQLKFTGQNGRVYQGIIHSFAESFTDACPIALVTVKSGFKPGDDGFLVMNVSDPSLVIRG